MTGLTWELVRHTSSEAGAQEEEDARAHGWVGAVRRNASPEGVAAAACGMRRALKLYAATLH